MKENVPPFGEEEVDPPADHPKSPSAEGEGRISPNFDLGEDEDSTDDPDLSSPIRPRHDGQDIDDRDFSTEPVSSPPINRSHHPEHRRDPRRRGDNAKSGERILVQATPGGTPQHPKQTTNNKRRTGGPDLRDVFSEQPTSEIDCSEDESGSTTDVDSHGRDRHYHGPDPLRQIGWVSRKNNDAMIGSVNGAEQLESPCNVAQSKVVSRGWSERWAFRGNSQLRVISFFLSRF